LVAARRDVGLDADDRFDACGGRCLIELDGAIERAMVCQRERRHPRLGGSAGHLPHPRQPVEQAEFRVDMEMNELLVRRGCHARSGYWKRSASEVEQGSGEDATPPADPTTVA